MESNTAEIFEEIEDEEVVSEPTATDFASLKRRLEITEEHLHTDSRNVTMHISEVIQEERDHKKSLMAMMGCLLFINCIVAVAAIVTFTMMISQ